jgi:hypothetical protein
MISALRKWNERGYADHGWLRVPKPLQFVTDFAHRDILRSIESAQPGSCHSPDQGCETHSHNDMKIIIHVR